LLWAAAIYLLMFTVSLAAFGALVVALPERYFVEGEDRWSANQAPLVRWLVVIGKNLVGLGLIALGLLLSLPGMPGQGLLTIAVGVVLLDIPGKHRLVRSLVRREGVLRNINRFRSWFGRRPLVVCKSS
jgi:hypothetical protein